jgi:tRNA dimethylallyltransferase
MKKPKIIVVLGQTATGKSDMAVQIAKDFDGEVISADSRQVYKDLDIGSGKIIKEEMQDVPHHLLDVVKVEKVFSVADFQRQAYEVIDDILSRGKVPIIAGGTAFYIQSIVDGIVLPEIEKNPELRKELEELSLNELQKRLEEANPKRYAEIDNQNKVRLIRALEIISRLDKVPELEKKPKYEVLQIGLEWPKEILHQRIHDRIVSRMKIGMLEEVEKLNESGVTWERLESLGLEYRYLSLLLQEKITKEEMFSELETKTKQFAKRQMTWWKKDDSILWYSPDDYSEIKKIIKVFIK